MDHGEVERCSARQWLEAFAVTRARIQREAILAHGAAFIVGNIAGYLFLTEAFALSLPVTFVVLLGASILLAFVVRDSIRKPHTTQLDLILSRQIKDCRLVERMLLGEISGAEITSHTPWPFKRLIALPADQSPARILSRVIPSLDWLDDWNVPKFVRWLVTLPLMPRGYADNLRRSVWIAAFNLDWMLDPPRRGLRPCWVLLPVQFALIIAVLVVSQTVTSGMQTAKVVHNLSGVLGFLILVLSFPGAMYFGRLLVWKDELIDYLRHQAAE